MYFVSIVFNIWDRLSSLLDLSRDQRKSLRYFADCRVKKNIRIISASTQTGTRQRYHRLVQHALPEALLKVNFTLQFVPFWVIPRRLSSNCQCFGTHRRFHLHRQVNEAYFIHLPMKMEPTVSSETSAIRTQTPGNYPKRNKLHLEHGESLKTINFTLSTPWRHRWAAEVQLHSFWIPALDEVGSQHQVPAALPTRKNPGRQSIGVWVRHRVGLRVL